MSKLYIIGNGFDLSHNLPTRFDPDFRNIAEHNEPNSYFWSLYSAYGDEIWSDFEHLLAKPDFNSLLEIFESYYPDYLSDYESDRDSIITVAEESGNLEKSLSEFAEEADESLVNIEAQSGLMKEFSKDDLFINFNYTHTLEKIYNIAENRILHIHGEVGKDNLIIGYPDGEYFPEKFSVDVRGKGRGPFRDVVFEQYLEEKSKDTDSFDYYVDTAYSTLIEKTKMFSKSPQIDLVNNFLDKKIIEEIVVRGHSCNIDFPYFKELNERSTESKWTFYSFDDETKENILKMIKDIEIKNYEIISL